AGDCDPDHLEDRTLNLTPEYTTRTSFANGTVHAYRCMNGYRPAQERRNATCRGTTWELDIAHPLNCQGISCGAPGGKSGIEHGTFRGHIFNFPNKVEFNCERGYRLHSHDNRPVDSHYAIYCKSDGQWTEPPPKCLVVVCPAPAQVRNGHVDTSSDFKFEAEARYSCERNYRLVGPPSRRCQENGTWSGPDPVCEEVKCPTPVNPPHGHVLVTGTAIGDTIIYRCSADSSTVSARCLSQGVWSHDPPQCSPGEFRTVTRGSTAATTTSTTTTTTTTVAPTREYCLPLSGPSHGKLFSADGFGLNASVIFSCDEGYVMRGPSNMTCRPGGVWDPPVPPTCFAPPPWLIILSVCLAGLATLVLCCLGLFYILKRRRHKSPPAQGYRRQIRKPSPYDAHSRDEVTHLGKPFPVTSL
ncbi:unnamed protein product, partial [Ixodes hexagonus]